MGHPHFTGQVSDKGAAQLSDSGFDAPCLSAALLKAIPNRYDGFKTPLVLAAEKDPTKKITLRDAGNFDTDLASLLDHVQKRLDQGVVEAWLSDQGYGATVDYMALVKIVKDASTGGDQSAQEAAIFKSLAEFAEYFNSPEEAWARAFSEMVVFSMYVNPGLLHWWVDDAKPVYDKFPTVYPIGIACQHLSTLCIKSRGFTDVGSGCACGAGTLELTCFDTAQSEKAGPLPNGTTKQTTAPSFANTTALSTKKAGPGSVVCFNPGGPGYGGQDMGPITHVGSILRSSGTRFQFIDTGVLVGNTEPSATQKTGEKPKPPPPAGGEGGTTDHGFRSGTLPAANNCVAVGVLKPAPGDLTAAAATIRKARPLGFARLAVLDIQNKDAPIVRFVSQMFHMKYPVSRFIWSLRGLPVDGLRVVWMIYAPQGADFTDELIANPTNTPRAIYDAAKTSWDAKRKVGEAQDKVTNPKAPWPAKHPFGLYLANIVRGEPGGDAAICRRKSDTKDGYVENFNAPLTQDLPPRPGPEMGQQVKMDLAGTPLLGVWARSLLDSQFINKGDGKPATNTDAAGSSFMK